ncbi:hypothetical protein PILCRDRAFT_529457 [Piloderma croceum F 1598]|uniref:Uncharacterized protein n=1 Tax=Piloderma croceum (strain F 1598) TaxID=765440 RepID=A0A0C3BTR5_PILCF|nr:hypothetical protein PILCRDRAFT_529457 [Piloderma croceum F 1598]
MLHTMNITYCGTEFSIPDFADAIQSWIISKIEGLASDNEIARFQTVKICYQRAFHSPNLPTLSRLHQLKGTGLEISFFQDGIDML